MDEATQPLSHAPLQFPRQRPGERVVMLIRRHWSVILSACLKFLTLIFIPPILAIVVAIFFDIDVTPDSALYILIIESVSLFYLFSGLSFFGNFLDYHLDFWVVTDQRIVSIEQKGLFRRTISELNVTRIQDVTSETSGKVQTFLNFGNVYVQTAGEQERFTFELVPRPADIARCILQVHDAALQQEDLRHARLQAEAEHELEKQNNPPQSADQTARPKKMIP